MGARIGGIPELVRDWETGLTYKPGDVDDLRQKIHMMIDKSYSLAEMGKKAREYVEKELNSDVYYMRLMNIY